ANASARTDKLRANISPGEPIGRKRGRKAAPDYRACAPPCPCAAGQSCFPGGFTGCGPGPTSALASVRDHGFGDSGPAQGAGELTVTVTATFATSNRRRRRRKESLICSGYEK